MLVTQDKLAELRRKAVQTRRLILQAVRNAGAGHVGGPFSATDILVTLYFSVLRIDPSRPDWEDRDRLILSKGHSAIALYTVMALRGYLPVEELMTFDDIDSRLQGHPDMSVLPGLDMSTGSLGQGLSPGIGMALGARMKSKDFRTWVVLGDGEIQEGQIWEAAFVASRYEVDNLTAILDYNKLQQYGWTDRVVDGKRQPRLSIENPQAKFAAFGWNVIECDGHDFEQILSACAEAQTVKGRPSIIVAHTIKGKGISFMENDYTWHARVPDATEMAAAMAELDAAEARG